MPERVEAANMPLVTVVAVVRDEEPYLEAMVRSILGQDYPHPLHMVLAVGPSRDRTREIADKLAAETGRVTVVDNPTGSKPLGLNAGLERMPEGHSIFVRVDGHTVAEPTYVRRAVEALQAAGADGVGGRMLPVGDTPVQKAVARAMSHPAGLGSASFHTGGSAGPAETVYLGTFRREALERVGGYSPVYVRAQDWELCLRLRNTGSLLWFDPSLVVEYKPRRTLGAVATQFWRTGMWRREVVRRNPGTANLRYLAPPTAVIVLGTSALVAVGGAVAGSLPLALVGLVPPAAYLLGVLAASAHAATRQPRLDLRSALALPATLVTMHMAWGAGFLRGLTDRVRVDDGV
ncbi:glycosyl transferase family 2 [Promicromonospora sp. AC04]|uniref:glycosyltransferase family 2 protein n=1 Tax=Promicromonospora sp. AC04 TaxID=2135723 RepID=UPI000D41CD69|nr:glycosyl transferase family 2 [Promicromonospora sp. AC04]